MRPGMEQAVYGAAGVLLASLAAMRPLLRRQLWTPALRLPSTGSVLPLAQTASQEVVHAEILLVMWLAFPFRW